MAVAKKETTQPKNELTIKRFDLNGDQGDQVPVSNIIFGTSVNKSVIAQYIRVYLINQRQGTASTKTRAEVTGTTKKIYKQKGTGKARHGSMKAPIFKGGGVVGGPKPKDYELTINKKQRLIALFGALTSKFKEGNIIGLSYSGKTSKTKEIAQFLKKMKMSGKKVLFILPEGDNEAFIRTSRNIENVKNIISTKINAYEVLSSDNLIFVSDAVNVLEKHFTDHKHV